MILWTIKQLNSVRLAIAGRQHPSQLAWGVAFGVLLGVVPHGNLMAVLLLLIVLSLKLNHAMAGLTAVGVTFAASYLDPYSHVVGHQLLTHPQTGKWAVQAWQYPLMPWTDLNNTVVLGSLSIGLASLIPAFVISYPLFRWLAPRRLQETAQDNEAAQKNEAAQNTDPLVFNSSTSSSLADDHPQRSQGRVKESPPVPAVASCAATIPSQGTGPASQIDARPTAAEESPRMEEALRFLLHQLRDSQPRDAA